jgi:hypothetical protein
VGKGKEKAFKVVTILVVVAILVCAFWIMGNKLGLVPDYDFGAGAYYYADIPGFENIEKEGAFKTSVPYWVHVVLFLGWGWLMYRFWVWIDKRK